MEKQCMAYEVRMQTSVGIRLGQMIVYRDGDRLNGYFEILNHNEPFEGTVDSEGNCRLHGRIITLMKTINYEAKGKITMEGLNLSIADEKHVLEITGTPSSLKGAI